jgi:hypothetical protein
MCIQLESLSQIYYTLSDRCMEQDLRNIDAKNESVETLHTIVKGMVQVSC